MSSDSEPLATPSEQRPSEPPPSLIPPTDSLRPPQPAFPDFPSVPLTLPADVAEGSLPASVGGEDGLEERRRQRDSLRVAIAKAMPPMPEVKPILEAASAARDAKDWETALEHYKKALFVIPPEAQSTRASIYASIAEVKAAQGKLREAETNFEKALVINPKHMRSIDGLVRLAKEQKDWLRLAVARRRRAEALDDPDEKAAELCVVAEVEETRLRSIEKALATLEIASVYRPDDVGILIKLRDLYTLTRQWHKLIDTLDDLVRVTTDPRHRGSFRFAQADIALGRLREEPRGLAFLEMALDEDPQCDRALSALVAVRTRREEWPELAAVYERLIDRYAGLGDRDRAWEVCRKLGVIRRDRLLDGQGAIEAFTGAVELRPDDAESRATLAELYAAKGDRTAAVRELEICAVVAPLRAQTYRRLFELHQRAQRPDRAWLAATCLEELGASDVSQELVIEQFRPDGPTRPTTAIAEEWWDELLAASGADKIVEEILLTIGEPAIALKLEALAAAKKLPSLDPAAKQDKNSTASAVRTFVWAARVMGVELPDMYVMRGVPSGIAAVPAASRSVALGPQVLAGRTVQQLAFLAGRHLTYYRPAHYPLVFFSTLAELSSLVLSAVRLVIPGISVPPPAPDGDGHVTSGLSGRLTPEQKKRLEEIVARLDARGGKLDLLAWIRGVELTATRVGLLLAGDLRTVMRLMKEEDRNIGELSFDAKRGDLLAYCVSQAYGELRERMGVAIHPIEAASSGKTPAAPKVSS
jgi:tetratricopeptide (TPR) repeat protein